MAIAFGECVLDPEARQLTRGGSAIALSPRAFELLKTLIESRPRAVPQQQLKDRLWPDTFVGRTNLARLVTEIRAAIGDARGRSRFVRTHHGFGYSFCGETRDQRGPARESPCRVLWGPREVALPEGEHLIGRAPECAVRVDTPKTSRHHARITVAGGRAVLEDLGSKNGTYLGTRRIEGPTPLDDGQEIGIGTAVLVFLRSGNASSTETA